MCANEKSNVLKCANENLLISIILDIFRIYAENVLFVVESRFSKNWVVNNFLTKNVQKKSNCFKMCKQKSID